MGENIKVWFDEETDILYISLKDGSAVDSEEIAENVRIEYDKQNQVIGIEIYNVTKLVAKNLAKEIEKVIKTSF